MIWQSFVGDFCSISVVSNLFKAFQVELGKFGNMRTCRVDLESWDLLWIALASGCHSGCLESLRSSVQVVMKKQNDTELLVLDLQISGESEISWSSLVPSVPNHVQQAMHGIMK